MAGKTHPDPAHEAFMRRSKRMILAAWDEIRELHVREKALIAIVAPTPQQIANGVCVASVYAVTNARSMPTLRRVLAQASPIEREVMEAPHRADLLKILYLEENGQMRFLAVPVEDSDQADGT